MTSFSNIVVFHPGAIGDVMLATPVGVALRANFPQARITYWTHPSLIELLSLLKSVDRVEGFVKDEGVLRHLQYLWRLKPDLLVDLAGSSRSGWLARFSGAKVVRYRKQTYGAYPIVHAVDNFLATLEPLSLEPLANKFPTISVGKKDLSAVENRLSAAGFSGKVLVGLVPGVGKLRSHRAWISDGWTYTARVLLKTGRYTPVLIGGTDEISLCHAIAQEVGDGCLNLAGELTLVETAALLKSCKAVVAGDTGPLHLSVAVGTPVVGLYGPTYKERSGPYGCLDTVVSQSHYCQCHDVKVCSLTQSAGPGECMSRIMLEEVFDQLRIVLADCQL